MTAPRFTQLIRSRIHECAPDHSVETITVGELRRAADEMADLYAALERMLAEFVDPQQGSDQFDSAIVRKAVELANVAIAKARGEAVRHG